MKSRLRTELREAVDYIDFTRSRTDTALKAGLMQQVDMAIQIAQTIHKRQSGRLAPKEVKKLIIEALRPLRFFDGRGYFFIDDFDGRFILLPTSPQLEGQIKPDNRDDQGVLIMRGLIAAAQQPQGEGFLRYRWYPPGEMQKMADKLSYVREFKPYGWLIGTGDYIFHWENQKKEEAIARLRNIRFGTSGYIAIADQFGKLLLSPSNRSLEYLPNEQLPEQARIALAKINAAVTHGDTIVQYDWIDFSSGTSSAKTAVVTRIEPWGWTLIATIYNDEIQSAISKEIGDARSIGHFGLTNLLISIGFALISSLIGSLLFSRWTGGVFQNYHRQIEAKTRALKHSEEHYHALADNGQALIWMSDSSKACNYFNLPWLNFTGRTIEQELGFGWAEGVHPDDLQKCISLYENASDLCGKFNLIYRLRRHDGEYRWIIDEGTPRFDESGQFLGYVGHCLDITDIKSVQEELAQHRLNLEKIVAERTHDLETANQKLIETVFAMESAGIGIQWIDVDTGRLINVNQFAAKMHGFSVDEMLNLSICDLNPEITS